MKRYSFLVPVVAVAIFVACHGPKKTAQNPAPVKKEEAVSTSKQADEKILQQDSSAMKHPTADRMDSLSGQQIVDNTLNKLKTRLMLTASQEPNVRGILNSTFATMGGESGKKYSNEEARTMSRDLIKRSNDSLLGILTSSQQSKLQSFGQH